MGAVGLLVLTDGVFVGVTTRVLVDAGLSADAATTVNVTVLLVLPLSLVTVTSTVSIPGVAGAE